jgi:hypothetical protein
MGRNNNWRGCDGIRLISHGEWSDPDLVAEIDGVEYTFNYWDIEDALWNEFLENEGVSEKDTYVEGTYNIADEWEEKFDEYCQANAYDYLCDVVYGGYFAEGSTSWHDDY